MWNYMWPILIVVGANTLYNICAKAIPDTINPFASLSITYVIAALLSFSLFFISSPQKNFIAEASKANWSSFALGAAIIGLEFGYICIYRAGWKISTGSLVANLSLACVLLVIGLIAYKESLSIKQISGIFVCMAGLFLICK